MLKRFDVPSFGELQLPAGCKTLLSALESQDELAAALTGYADAWDCGAVPLEDVLRVVTQTLINIRHGARGRNKTHSEGGQGMSRVLAQPSFCCIEATRTLCRKVGSCHVCLFKCLCLPQGRHTVWSHQNVLLHSGKPILPTWLSSCCKNHISPAGAIARAVSAALCSHFKVGHVLRLGYGPVQGLMREAEETAVLAATPSGPPQGADGAAAVSSGETACWPALALTSNGKFRL